jgi:hypothetical protein
VVTEQREHRRIVLVPSTLLGPAVWAPVAAVLVDRGWRVQVLASHEDVQGPDDVLRRLLAQIPPGEPVLLVPHSNAGLYVAALAVERDVRGIVFVDSRLPSDAPTTPTASPEFRAYLAGLVGPDGRLPPWTEWWPGEDVDSLFPHRRVRAVVEAEQPRLPLAYFDDQVPTPLGWTGLPAAYVAFGQGAYEDEVAEARTRGWPIERMTGRHLHQLVDPDGVATVLEGLLGRLGSAGSP